MKRLLFALICDDPQNMCRDNCPKCFVFLAIGYRSPIAFADATRIRNMRPAIVSIRCALVSDFNKISGWLVHAIFGVFESGRGETPIFAMAKNGPPSIRTRLPRVLKVAVADPCRCPSL